jgi:hypothetical protein
MECGYPTRSPTGDCNTSARFRVKRTPQDSASMHSAFAARNVLFFAPFHSPRLRMYCDVACGRRSGFARVPHFLSELFLCLQRIHKFLCILCLFLIICVHLRISAVQKLFSYSSLAFGHEKYHRTVIRSLICS